MKPGSWAETIDAEDGNRNSESQFVREKDRMSNET